MDLVKNLMKTKQILGEIAVDKYLCNVIQDVAVSCVESLRAGGTIFLAGNGGSAADAQHIAGELVSTFAINRPALRAIALTTDTSILTAIANDFGYEYVFARQIEALARAGDVLIAYSTSGNSRNVIQALRVAQRIGVVTVGMTGNRKGEIVQCCDFAVEVPSSNTPRIQEAHLVLGHFICEFIEATMFP